MVAGNLDDAAGGERDVLKMLRFQQQIEKLAFDAGGGNLVAPAQRMVDFVENTFCDCLAKLLPAGRAKSIALKKKSCPVG